MRHTTDLVRDSKLRTAYRDGITRHIIDNSDHHGRRKLKVEQKWQRVGGNLGAGTFGVVWKEALVSGESDVQHRAVKMIQKRIGNSHAVDYSRELEAIAKFSRGEYRPFFVESYGWYESRDHVFIAMEYFEHGDLQAHLESAGSMSEEDVRQISYQILEGIHKMHENGFAHRDLKPSNILIRRTKDHEEGWWVKIGDFGVSKRAEEGMTALRTVSGTTGFQAPEVLVRKGCLYLEEKISSRLLKNEHEYTCGVDMWALGEITYRAICGSSPFTTGLAAYVNGKNDFPIDTLSRLKISDAGIDLICQLMQVFPEKRPTSTAALKHPWFSPFQDYSSKSSGEFESIDENMEIPSDFLSPNFDPEMSSSSGMRPSEFAAWTDLDGINTSRPETKYLTSQYPDDATDFAVSPKEDPVSFRSERSSLEVKEANDRRVAITLKSVNAVIPQITGLGAFEQMLTEQSRNLIEHNSNQRQAAAKTEIISPEQQFNYPQYQNYEQGNPEEAINEARARENTKAELVHRTKAADPYPGQIRKFRLNEIPTISQPSDTSKISGPDFTHRRSGASDPSIGDSLKSTHTNPIRDQEFTEDDPGQSKYNARDETMKKPQRRNGQKLRDKRDIREMIQTGRERPRRKRPRKSSGDHNDALQATNSFDEERNSDRAHLGGLPAEDGTFHGIRTTSSPGQGWSPWTDPHGNRLEASGGTLTGTSSSYNAKKLIPPKKERTRANSTSWRSRSPSPTLSLNIRMPRDSLEDHRRSLSKDSMRPQPPSRSPSERTARAPSKEPSKMKKSQNKTEKLSLTKRFLIATGVMQHKPAKKDRVPRDPDNEYKREHEPDVYPWQKRTEEPEIISTSPYNSLYEDYAIAEPGPSTYHRGDARRGSWSSDELYPSDSISVRASAKGGKILGRKGWRYGSSDKAPSVASSTSEADDIMRWSRKVASET